MNPPLTKQNPAAHWFTAAITLILIAPLSRAHDGAHDDWNKRWDPIQPGERLKFRIGSFIVDRYDTTARLDSKQFPLGTLIDLEDDFDVDSRETVARIDGFYRFSSKHRLNWSYYRSRRSGSALARREITIGDPDDPMGGFVIPKDAQVKAKWNFDLLKLGYDYSFLNKRRYEMFIGAGLNIRSMDISIAYQASIGENSTGAEFAEIQWVPLPTGVIGGRWNLTRKLQATFTYDLFYLEFQEYSGNYQEVMLSLEHNTFKHVGFGAAIDLASLNLRAKTDDWRGEFDSRVAGIFAYLKFFM